MKITEISSDDVEPPDWLPNLKQAVDITCARIDLPAYEIGIRLCNDRKIAELNQQFRGADGPTDVLSFSQVEGEQIPPHANRDRALIGDLVISLESVFRNASEFDVTPSEEVTRVVVHGVLHLAGYSHGDSKLNQDGAESTSTPMFAIQESIVTELNKEKTT